MEQVKSHLDFTPRNCSGPCFRDLDYSPFDVNNTKSRRQHLAAYLKFMRPEIDTLLKVYGRRASYKACETLYDKFEKRAVPEPYFEFMVDNYLWKLWFQPFGFDGPRWPWGAPKTCSRNLKPGDTPSRVFGQYCERRKMEDAERNALVAHVAPRALPEAAPVIDPNSRFILRSHAIFGSAPEPDSDLFERQRTWEKQPKQDQQGDGSGIVGPFEIELPSLVPIEKFVAPDLAEINKLIEKDAVIKVNMTQRKVIVSFPEEDGADDAKQRHSEVWKRVLGWNGLAGNGRDITLCEHLSLVLERD
ncbi:unnamed protein product [Fusarium equiseti]|uniref:Uncharacterized protein n=1 Tax=Fusarium equiseti TaxID=61235 RepID=A0A8J2IT77_FUSEQ|nr:unnamed protein product [Fusarium equiseti]